MRAKLGVDGNSRAGRGGNAIDVSGKDDVEVDGSEIEVNEVGKKVQKLSKSKNSTKSKKKVRSSDFFTLGTKLTFTELKQVFLKALIFYHFDLEYHI